MRRDRPRWIRRLRVGQRRAGLWLDRQVSRLELDKDVPSWGASLLIHAFILLLMALMLYVGRGRDGASVIEAKLLRLGDDVTSLVDGERSGDPFTRLQTEEAPSLSLETAMPDVTLINQPRLPDDVRFAPALTVPDFLPAMPRPSLIDGVGPKVGVKINARARGMSNVIGNLHVEDMTAPFSGRGDPMLKAKLVRRGGGTVKSEKAVQDGLDWLARHQRNDGSWSLSVSEQCQGDNDRCPIEDSIGSDSAATGLALLPLLGAGNIHTAKSRYQSNVRRGIDWLVANQQPNGDLYVGAPGMPHMYSHAIATMALCESYGLSQDPKLRAPAQLAIDFIVDSQNTATGGWRYAPGQTGDTSVFGWMMFALRSARLSGLRVPRNVLNGCRVYLDSAAADPKKVTYGYLPGREATPVMTAEALLSRQYLGWPRNYPALIKGAGQVAAHLESSDERNIYYWYYATQLLHNMQNKDWERWNPRVRDGLVAMQVGGEGCARGSWSPYVPQPDRWGRVGGRLFVTSLSILTLEVYYRYLPLYNPTDDDKRKLDDDSAPVAVAKP